MKYPITLTAMLFSIMPMAAMAQSDPQEAKKIFDQMCAGCHGYRGDGGEGRRGKGEGREAVTQGFPLWCDLG